MERTLIRRGNDLGPGEVKMQSSRAFLPCAALVAMTFSFARYKHGSIV